MGAARRDAAVSWSSEDLERPGTTVGDGNRVAGVALLARAAAALIAGVFATMFRRSNCVVSVCSV